VNVAGECGAARVFFDSVVSFIQDAPSGRANRIEPLVCVGNLRFSDAKVVGSSQWLDDALVARAFTSSSSRTPKTSRTKSRRQPSAMTSMKYAFPHRRVSSCLCVARRGILRFSPVCKAPRGSHSFKSQKFVLLQKSATVERTHRLDCSAEAYPLCSGNAPDSRWAQPTLISMRRGFASSRRGIVSFRTPSFSAASIRDVSKSSLTLNWREK